MLQITLSQSINPSLQQSTAKMKLQPWILKGSVRAFHSSYAFRTLNRYSIVQKSDVLASTQTLREAGWTVSEDSRLFKTFQFKGFQIAWVFQL